MLIVDYPFWQLCDALGLFWFRLLTRVNWNNVVVWFSNGGRVSFELFNMQGKLANHWKFKQGFEIYIGVGSFGQSRNYPDSQKGMTTQQKKVVIGIHTVNTKHILKYLRNDLLHTDWRRKGTVG